MCKKQIITGILLLCFVVPVISLICVYYLPNDWTKQLNSYQETPSSFSVMTFNIDAGDSLKFTEDCKKKLIAFVEKFNPSILCLQELSFENHERIKPHLDSIYGSCASVLSTADNKWRFLFYSRYPIRNFRRYKGVASIDTTGFDEKLIQYCETISEQLPVMSAEFEVQSGYWVTIFSGHLRSSAYSTARRTMDKGTIWFEGIPLYWENFKIGKRIRDYEARSIRYYIVKDLSEGKPVIAAGDLNDWCGSDCLNIFQGSGDSYLTDAWSEGGSGFGFTYFGWHLRLRIDHILYSKNLNLERVNVLESDISDHRPLVAVFRMKEK